MTFYYVDSKRDLAENCQHALRNSDRRSSYQASFSFGPDDIYAIFIQKDDFAENGLFPGAEYFLPDMDHDRSPDVTGKHANFI
jgi:hypothetical protein